MKNSKDKLIVALDVDTFEEARGLIDALGDSVGIYKVGSQLFTACGPVVVRYINSLGKKVFLDLKFHDIPNTVANALRSAVNMGKEIHEVLDADKGAIEDSRGVFMCTVHTLGGKEMLERAAKEAKESAEKIGVKKPIVVGITVLTSEAVGDNVGELVLARARLAKDAGLDGVVASSQEAELIRNEFGDDFVVVTPGIRPKGADVGDQKRVTTPFDAIKNGSDFLVVGRPIVKAEDQKKAAEDILKEIEQAENQI